MNEQEKKRLEMLEASEKKLKDRYKYQNEYIKNNYDKIVLTLPKGFKKEVENIAKNKGFKNITEYVKELLKNEIIIFFFLHTPNPLVPLEEEYICNPIAPIVNTIKHIDK